MQVEAIQARIAASKEKHERLAERCAAFMSGPKPYEVYVKPTMEMGMYAVRLRVLRDPPLDWGVDVGDIGHGLRSALNQLVTELVRANGREPSRTNQFPIFVDQRAYRAKGRRGVSPRESQLAGVSRRDKRMIDAVQRFGRVPASTHRDPLAQLQWLNNRDKHVELQPAFVRVDKWGWHATHPHEGPIPKMEMRLAQMNPRGPMADGELLVVAGWPGQPGVEITAAETDCAVGFGDRGMTVDGFDRMILAVSVLVERAARRHD
jgi:hypothetical protein